MATKVSTFHGQNAQAGASLVTVLISLALISIASVSVMGAIGGYYEGKKRLDAFDSAGEAQRMLLGEITETIRRYALFQGCTGTAPVNLGAFQKMVQTVPGTTAAAVNSRIGRLCRMPSQCANVVFERDGAGGAAGAPPAYVAASAARATCPGTVPGATAQDFQNCFRFEPLANSGSAAQNAFLRPGNQIFIHVRSEIMNLRNFTALTCASVIRNNNVNFRNFSVAGALTAAGGQLPFLTYSESRVLGSGIRHTYSLYWESGPAGKKNYFRKSGVLYVPNNVAR